MAKVQAFCPTCEELTIHGINGTNPMERKSHVECKKCGTTGEFKWRPKLF